MGSMIFIELLELLDYQDLPGIFGGFLQGGSPKWMVCHGKFLLKLMIWGTPILRNLHFLKKNTKYTRVDPLNSITLPRKGAFRGWKWRLPAFTKPPCLVMASCVCAQFVLQIQQLSMIVPYIPNKLAFPFAALVICHGWQSFSAQNLRQNHTSWSFLKCLKMFKVLPLAQGLAIGVPNFDPHP